MASLYSLYVQGFSLPLFNCKSFLLFVPCYLETATIYWYYYFVVIGDRIAKCPGWNFGEKTNGIICNVDTESKPALRKKWALD